MTYSVKEIYYTLQGEGAHAGRPAIFCRFTGCNLWSGQESDRMQAVCQFCDTDFVGTDGPNGGRFKTAEALADSLLQQWPVSDSAPYVVFTGGEPALQLDSVLIQVLHARGVLVAIETNGTKPLPTGIDWICVSPKANTDLLVTCGDELKLVYPQRDVEPQPYLRLDFKHFYLQPMDGLDDSVRVDNTEKAVRYCLQNPSWQLSLQTHKLLNIP